MGLEFSKNGSLCPELRGFQKTWSQELFFSVSSPLVRLLYIFIKHSKKPAGSSNLHLLSLSAFITSIEIQTVLVIQADDDPILFVYYSPKFCVPRHVISLFISRVTFLTFYSVNR